MATGAVALVLIGVAITLVVRGSPAARANTAAHATITARVIPTTRLCYSASARDQPYPHVVAATFGALDIPCGHRPPKGYKFLGASIPETVIALVNITFKARLPANDRHSVYEYSDARSSGPTRCTLNTGGESGTTESPIHVGQTIMLQDAPVCPGTYVGIISYQAHGAAGRDTLSWRGPVDDGSIIVGRYSYVVH
jgi:hypothetical protein